MLTGTKLDPKPRKHYTERKCEYCLDKKGKHKTKQEIIGNWYICTLCGKAELREEFKTPVKQYDWYEPDPVLWERLGFNRISRERRYEGLRKNLVWGR